jgi:hypothetical protein
MEINNHSVEGGFNITAGVKEVGAIGGEGDMSVSGTGTILKATRIRQMKISIGDGSTLAIREGGGADATGGTGELIIDGSGKFDIADSALRLQHVGQTPTEALAAVTTWIKTARDTAPVLWQGPGITSSTAAAQPNGITGIGVLVNNDGKGNKIVTQLNGLEVDLDDVLVKFTYNGDMDLNGSVDADDYALIDLAFATQGDPLGSAHAAAVPEPNVIFTIALASLCLFAPRSKNRTPTGPVKVDAATFAR